MEKRTPEEERVEKSVTPQALLPGLPTRFEQGQRVVVRGRDSEGRTTYRTATVSTVRKAVQSTVLGPTVGVSFSRHISPLTKT